VRLSSKRGRGDEVRGKKRREGGKSLKGEREKGVRVLMERVNEERGKKRRERHSGI
jgi:hypothetical protein